MNNIKVLNTKTACEKVGMKRAKFLYMQDFRSKYYVPSFPKKVRCGARSVGWLEHELDAWIEQQAADRHPQPCTAKIDETKSAALPEGGGIHQLMMSRGEDHV